MAALMIPHHFSNVDNSVSTDSNDVSHSFERDVTDETSCCSNDTILSVGNENPVQNEESQQNQPLTFKNIESHLNAISQMDPFKDRSPSSPASSFKSVDSPNSNYLSMSEKSCPTSPADSSSFNPALRAQRLSLSPVSPRPAETQRFLFRPNGGSKVANTNNNDEGQGNLKFSIDNILKADFGRRITDPLNIKKAKAKKVAVAPTEADEGGKALDPVDLSKSEGSTKAATPSSETSQPMLWPAWVYCTRYSDRPSSGPRTRRVKKPVTKAPGITNGQAEEKRPRTAFSGAQLGRLKHEFAENRYLTERRRQQLSQELGLNEAQIKIWFQNKRAKIKKASGQKNPLALQLMAQGLYNHSTIPLTKEEEELQELQTQRTKT